MWKFSINNCTAKRSEYAKSIWHQIAEKLQPSHITGIKQKGDVKIRRGILE